MRLRNLYEVQIKPGERRGFSLRLKKLEDLQLKVAEMQNTIANLKSTSVPDVLKKQMQDLIDTANMEKEKLYSSFDTVTSTPSVEGIPGNVLKLFQGIEKNSTRIIDAYRKTGKFLYRGIKSDEDALYGKPFDERRAKDSNRKLSDILNNALAAQGFDARRDNTSFTSGTKSQASNYGTVYVIIPRDGFTFHYSKNTKDLVLDASKLNMLVDNDLAKQLTDLIHSKWAEVKQYFPHRYEGDRMFLDYDYERDIRGLQEAVAAGLLPNELSKYNSIEDFIDNAKVIQYFQYDKDDIVGAIESGHEVMVRGPYYAIRADKFENYFKKYIELTASGPVKTPPRVAKSKDNAVTNALGAQSDGLETGVVVKHKYEPVYGEIVNAFYTNDFVQVKNFDGNLILVKKSNIEKIDMDKVEKYEPGDRVVLNTEGTIFDYLNKKRAKVEKVNGITLTVSYGTYGDTVDVPIFFVNPSPKFSTDDPQVGDSVKITKGEFTGEYGIITYVSSYSKDIDVNFGDGASESVTNGQYEVVDPKSVPKDKTAVPFQEGEYVEIAHDGEKMSGLVGTIKTSGSVKSTVRIFGGTGVHPTQSITNKRIKKISQEEFEKRKLEYEAEVVVVKGSHRGKTGKITYFYSDGKVEISTGSGFFEVDGVNVVLKDKYTGKLDLTKQPEKKQEEVKLKSGDSVYIHSGTHAGTIAKVEYVYSNGQTIEVKLPDGKFVDVATTKLEKSGAEFKDNEQDDLIDLTDLEFEPLDEPTPPKTSNEGKPKVGDTVKIIKGKDVGNMGKIGYIYSSGESVEIEFADGSSDVYNISNIEVVNKSSTEKSFDPDALPFMVGDDANATNPNVVNKKWEIAEIHPDHVILKNKTSQGTLKLPMDKFYKANPEYDTKSFKPGDKVLFTSGNFKDFEGVVVSNDTPTQYDNNTNSGDIKVKIKMYGKDHVIPTSISNVKKTGVSDDIVFPSSVKTSAEAESIVKKAKESGTITYSQVDKIFDGSADSQGAEDIFKMFDNMGINVIPDPDLVNPDETPEEKKQRIVEPKNKAELLELLKDKEVKPIMRKAINDKILSYLDQLNLVMAADEKYYTLLLPYLELKGVKTQSYEDAAK